MGALTSALKRSVASSLALGLTLVALSASNAPAESVPGTPPATPQARSMATTASPGGLHVVVNERGRISKSVAAASSNGATSIMAITKPAGATVRGAYLATATTGFTSSPLSSGVELEGFTVPLAGEIPSGISSWNYFADVTGLIKPTVDSSPAGAVSLSYREPQAALTDGSILVVVFDDPTVSVDQSVTVLFGALRTSGDQYLVKLAAPVDASDPETRLEMGLGISFSYQRNGTQQYSTVEVNGRRLSTAAGGEDDGYSSNGGLITVGGDGDDAANPSDSTATPTNPRSDDELYDLRPYVEGGATSISVETTNPSNDDNVFLATFTMNPPVVSISNGKEKFVYVALGDSYQSGEGAGYSIRPQDSYLATAFENGSNYPESVGPQENTFTSNAQGDQVNGTGCHRALLNYAKINRDKLSPDSEIVLIDRTCSGATIEPSSGGKPPIVGKMGQDPDPSSQMAQALSLLAAEGLSADDVSLVTVGMGGNDARFGDIVMECVLPAVLQSLLERYPNAPGEITWITQQVTCKVVDDWFVKTGSAIESLGEKEKFALGRITGTFSKARVLQLNYPNILPYSNSPEWCGGIRAKDIDFARSKLLAINDQVRKGIAASPGVELVDVAPLVGPNALCPAGNGKQLANGIEKSKFDLEVARLLNLNGNGDAKARGLLDALVSEYNDAKSCYSKHYVPLGDNCDTNAANKKVMDKGKALLDYLNTQQERIFANVVSPPGTTDDSQAVGFDRSRNLFHPNADAFAVDACAVLNVYENNADLSPCSKQSSPVNTTPTASWNPISARVGDLLRIVVQHFLPGSRVELWMFSTPISLGTVVAETDGSVDTTISVPNVSPGIHRIELRGEGAGGVQVTQQILVDVEGRPSGGYTTYIKGFTTAPENSLEAWDPEFVDVHVGDVRLGTFQVDEHGGVLVTIPVLGNPLAADEVTIRAVSQTSGKSITEIVRPIPMIASLWALSPSSESLSIVGSGFQADGLVHSEAGVVLAGSGAKLLGGAEYVTNWRSVSSKGSTVNPTPVKVQAGQGAPLTSPIADYRPGGSVASTASTYRAVPKSQCIDGMWRARSGDVGVVYVPCGVVFGKSGDYPATYAAEGRIVIKGTSVAIGPTDSSSPIALVSGATGKAVELVGSGVTVRGQTSAIAGELALIGSGNKLQCGAIAKTIVVTGARNSSTVHGCMG